MFTKLQIPYQLHRSPDHTLNEIKPYLYALNVVLELQNNDHWTHAQRSKFSFVMAELLSKAMSILRETEVSKNNGDVGDIPF